MQSYYSVCIAYATFRQRMQISENFLYAQLLRIKAADLQNILENH